MYILLHTFVRAPPSGIPRLISIHEEGKCHDTDPLEPVSGLAQLTSTLNRMFDAAFRGEPLRPAAGCRPWTSSRPLRKDLVVVKADLPEMKARRHQSHVREQCAHHRRRAEVLPSARDRESAITASSAATARFRRSFTLPASVDASRVDAAYQDGVLTVKLPRRAENTAPPDPDQLTCPDTGIGDNSRCRRRRGVAPGFPGRDAECR